MNIEIRLLVKQAIINTVGPVCSFLCEGLLTVMDAAFKAHLYMHRPRHREP
jgi:hypothetical protein